jgi:replicative DNA helicase
MDLHNSREAEVSVLATILVETGGFSRVYSIIKPEDFFYPDTKKVFQSMFALFSKGLEINIQSLMNYFKVEGYSGMTEVELREFLDYRVSVETAVTFATQIAEFSGWRSLKFGLEKVNKYVESKSINLQEAAQTLSSLVTNVTSKGLKDDVVHGVMLVEEYFKMLNRPKGMYVFSGIKDVDENIYDFNPKELSYVAARPGVGKTTFMLQSAYLNAKSGNKVGFLSMEMERPKIINRLVSHVSEVSGTTISRMSSSEFKSNKKLVYALEAITKLGLFIDDTGPWTSDSVPQKIRKMYYEYGCNLIYVDYIGLIIGSGNLASSPRNQQLSHISASLKGLSSELAIPILAASQLNRDVEKRGSPRPGLSDLRDSGSLEQDASIVAFLYPSISDTDNKSLFDKAADLPAILEIAKQRNGPVNQYDVVLHRKYGKFESKEKVNATF